MAGICVYSTTLDMQMYIVLAIALYKKPRFTLAKLQYFSFKLSAIFIAHGSVFILKPHSKYKLYGLPIPLLSNWYFSVLPWMMLRGNGQQRGWEASAPSLSTLGLSASQHC